MDTDDLLGWRDEFPILADSTYLISNSLGAMPRAVFGEMQHYAETWATRGVRAWADGWWELPITVAETCIAPLLNAQPGTVSMHGNISLIQALLISCFDFSGERNRIVIPELEFPSVRYVYEQLAVPRGAELIVVPSSDGMTHDTERFLAAIDERTLLVPVSHVLFKSAFIMDADAIIRRAHEVGAKVILDGYQSVGTVPVDVQALGVDFFVGGVLKWLCGGPGGCFLYVRPDLIPTLSPGVTGWQAHRRPFAFEGEMDLRDDAFRFLNGTPPIPSLHAVQPGPKLIQQVGMAAIRAKSMRQTARLLDLADANGFPTHTPRDPDRRGGTVAFDVPHGYEVSRELLRREVIVDYRPGAGIRVSPHFYTADGELDHAIAQIRDILDTRAYEAHTVRTSLVS